MNRDAVVKCIETLRADGRALQGDGFGYIGTLKSAYKNATKALDKLVEVLDDFPEKADDPIMPMPEIGNPDCLGRGADNVPGCTCRLVFEGLK